VKISFSIDTDALADELGVDRSATEALVRDNYDAATGAGTSGVREYLRGAGIPAAQRQGAVTEVPTVPPAPQPPAAPPA